MFKFFNYILKRKKKAWKKRKQKIVLDRFGTFLWPQVYYTGVKSMIFKNSNYLPTLVASFLDFPTSKFAHFLFSLLIFWICPIKCKFPPIFWLKIPRFLLFFRHRTIRHRPFRNTTDAIATRLRTVFGNHFV